MKEKKLSTKSKIKTLTSDHSGITLIALVITIIVMLILVAVTVTVALNGGLFKSAKQATADTEIAREEESELSNGKVNIDNTIYNSIDEYVGATSGGEYKTVAELFDASKEKYSAITGNNNYNTDGKLHIGDFINYTAGTWGDEINAIKTGEKNNEVEANKVRDNLPTQAYQFGGFAEGDSRDGNAKPYDDEYNYVKVKDGEKEKEITGWRLFDVDEEEGTITLISAGCPEDFYVPSSSTYSGKGGYISEYILSGNENSSASGMNLDTNYTKRNWNDYVKGKATGANAITKKDLDDWYNKYMEITGANTYTDATFQKIYKTRYENLIDNYSYYWLASANYSYSVYGVNPGNRYVASSSGNTRGVRVLITLGSDIQLSKSCEKTVNNIANDSNRIDKPYTYNVWNIQ